MLSLRYATYVFRQQSVPAVRFADRTSNMNEHYSSILSKIPTLAQDRLGCNFAKEIFSGEGNHYSKT